MNRTATLDRLLNDREPWDVAVIGGGATGAGIALDAASRGLRAALLERADFGQGTSSRSTKLIHGGVRYLRQARFGLVFGALRERRLLLRNAPHIVHELPLIAPAYSLRDRWENRIGLKLYDWLAGRDNLTPSSWLGREAAIRRVPTLRAGGLRGGVLFHDGQFDDARLLIAILATADAAGAAVVNYVRAAGLKKDEAGRINGVAAVDVESGREFSLRARVVVNAAGPFVDTVIRMDDPSATPRIAPSQGIHITVDRSFLPSDAAVLVPRTSDGRVIFAIPWLGKTLIGTTDTPLAQPDVEPRAHESEIDYLIETIGRWLDPAPTRADIRSVFAGVRPLVRAAKSSRSSAGASRARRTSQLGRDHLIDVSASGLVTIAGGKWTTYREMAEECVDRAIDVGALPRRPCTTGLTRLVELESRADATSPNPGARILHERLPYDWSDVERAVRVEMARTVEDVLSRRTRALPLDAAAAMEAAEPVAQFLASELGRDEAWQAAQLEQFATVVRHHQALS